MTARYAAVGFLFHAPTRQVLLHRRDTHATYYPETWAFFGGGNEPEDGGDPLLTWRREMGEELGVDLDPEQIVFLRSYVNPDANRPRFIFCAPWPTPDAAFALTEGDGYSWFALGDALALPDLVPLARADLIVFLERVLGEASSADPRILPDR